MIHKIDKLITNENNLPKFVTCCHFPSHLILTLYFLNHLEAISWSLSFKAQLFLVLSPALPTDIFIEETRLLGFNQALLHASNHKVW